MGRVIYGSRKTAFFEEKKANLAARLNCTTHHFDAAANWIEGEFISILASQNTPGRRLRVKSRADQNRTLTRKPNYFEPACSFVDNRKVYILPTFRHKQAQPRTQGPNGSALNLAGDLCRY